ncbi:hypothetical protein D3C85_1768740 [compost metagenome]
MRPRCQEGTPYSCSSFLSRRLPPRPTGLSMLPAATPKRTVSGSSSRGRRNPSPTVHDSRLINPSSSGNEMVSPIRMGSTSWRGDRPGRTR